MGLNTNSSFIPSSYFCKGTMNPCKIQIFRYSFEGVTVLSLKGNIVEQQMKLCRNFLEECRSLNCWCDETEVFFIIATEYHGTTRTCRENPCRQHVRVLPLLLQGGLLMLQTIETTQSPTTKKSQPFCELALCF